MIIVIIISHKMGMSESDELTLCAAVGKLMIFE